MPPPADEIRSWTRRLPDKSTYTISTDPSLIQLDAINAAFDTDMIYWAKPLPLPILKRCVEQSLCFGLYFHEEEGANGPTSDAQQDEPAASPAPPPMTEKEEEKEKNKKRMVGLARVVTDYTTFAYLTDVYVLPAHQGRGLGRWLMACLDEVLGSWPALRRCLLLTRDEAAVRMYGATIGARVLQGRAESDGGGGGGDRDGKGEGASKKGGLFILERKGPGIKFLGEQGSGSR